MSATTEAIRTFADCQLNSGRCCSCAREFATTAPAEGHATHASLWAVVYCAHCYRWTPLQLEAK